MRAGTHDFLRHRQEKRFCSLLQHIRRRLQPGCAFFIRVGLRFGIEKSQCGYTLTMLPPELEERIPTYRNSSHWDSADLLLIQNLGQVLSMLRHGDGPVACIGIAMSTQVRKNQRVVVA